MKINCSVRMADVSEKNPSERIAKARGRIKLKKETVKLVKQNRAPKGDIFAPAKIAAISAAKSTQHIIPLCHPLRIDFCDAEFYIFPESIEVETTVKTFDRTGAEMEAMTAAAAALLSMYDMLKPVDRSIIIQDIKLVYKSGGKSGTWQR